MGKIDKKLENEILKKSKRVTEAYKLLDDISEIKKLCNNNSHLIFEICIPLTYFKGSSTAHKIEINKTMMKYVVSKLEEIQEELFNNIQKILYARN